MYQYIVEMSYQDLERGVNNNEKNKQNQKKQKQKDKDIFNINSKGIYKPFEKRFRVVNIFNRFDDKVCL